MIPRAYITAWRSTAPWPDDAQVEQDLVLARALTDLFSDPLLSKEVALRGGTALHKLILTPARRFSEDLDLVQVNEGPIGPILDAVRARLGPWLGEAQWKRGHGGFTLRYRYETEFEPVRHQRLKLEINTREHFAVLGLEHEPFKVESPWFDGQAEIVVYRLEELLATKLRALYQRKKGRDLFDLWLALTTQEVDSEVLISCFLKYMEHEGHAVSRAEFEANVAEKIEDERFTEDIAPLLVTGLGYDSKEAAALVLDELIARLPGAPWKGHE